MTDDVHPSLDALADDASDPEIATHVASCGDCAAAMAALDEVSVLLATEAATAIPMPADVLDAIDLALDRAALEDNAGVTSLSQRRLEDTEQADKGSRSGRSGSRHSGRLVKALGAAAAIVVIGGIGYSIVNNPNLGGTDDSSMNSSAADAGGSAEQGPDVSSGHGGGGGDAYRIAPKPRLNKHNLALRTQKSLDSAATAATADAFLGPCRPIAAKAAAEQIFVNWQGRNALLVVDQGNHLATIYPCLGAQHSLFETRYEP